ncbi:MAG: class I SAM-dependent methyltransferase [Treponema sp.]|jgi:23S rRNA G2069 N7-methylase RlmK/C1962 C5-methylase RlmI|nr:class I SAM-dependent methyltransferase [Treponema sp.]
MNTTEEKTAQQAEMLVNRLQKRFKHLKKWAIRMNTDAFRLYDRDIPEIPLLLDYYAGAIAGSLYKRPYEVAEEAERVWLLAMQRAIASALALPATDVFLKMRERQRGAAQYDKLREAGVVRDVHEGGLTFRVNLSDYLDAGLFLDARPLRALVKNAAAGKRVLNLYGYTGSFSVYALAGGAVAVDSVDLSHTYLNWAALNGTLNGFDTSMTAPAAFFDEQRSSRGGDALKHRAVAMDVSRFLEEAARRRLSWDIIVLDPPSFSNSKRMIGTLDLRRDHETLITRCLSLLAYGGTLYFSANARGFHLTPEAYPQTCVKDLTAALIDEDFRGKRTPSRYVFTKKNEE